MRPTSTRPVAAIVVAGLAALLLSGCSIAASREGQEVVDRDLEQAGLTDTVTARVSCTGALPGRVDHCNTRVEIVTDDADVLEQAADLESLAGGTAKITFRGVLYRLALADWQVIPTFSERAPSGVDITEVGFTDTDVPHIIMPRTTPVADGCVLAEALAPDYRAVSVSNAFDSVPEWSLTFVREPVSAAFADACVLMDEALSEHDEIEDVDYQPNPTAGDELTFRTTTDTAREDLSEWVAGHPDTAGLRIDVF